MNKLVKLILIFGLLFLVYGCIETHKWDYSLSFPFNTKEIKDWKFLYSSKYANLKIDSFSSTFTLLNKPTNNKIKDHFKVYYQRNLILGENKSGDVSICFKTKGTYLKKAFVSVAFFDSLQHFVYEDTFNLSINNESKWRKKLFKAIKAANYLRLTVKIEGDEDSIPINSNVTSNYSSLTLDSCIIYSNKPFHRLSETKKENKIADNVFIDSTNFFSIDNAQISALAQTMEGTDEFDQFSFDYMKYAIENKGVDLLLLNFPMDRLFIADRYIQGDTLYNLEEALYAFENTPYSFYRICLFLDYLKEHNEKKSNKVHILGYETTSEEDELYRFLPDFLFPQVQLDSTLINNVLNVIINTPVWESPNQASVLYKLLSKKNIKLGNCSDKEVQLLMYFLNQIRWNLGNEDIDKSQLNAANINYLISKYSLNKKIILLGDIASLIKSDVTSNDYTKTLGQYLSQKYGENYKVYGLCSKSGKVRVLSEEGLYSHKKLQKAPTYSIEGYNFSYHVKPILFFLTSDIKQPLMIRSKVDTTANYNGMIVNPSNSLDAIVFFKNVTPSKIIDSDLKRTYDKPTIMWRLSQRYESWRLQKNLFKNFNPDKELKKEDVLPLSTTEKVNNDSI